MSTRSYICIKLSDEDKKKLDTEDEYLGVYCHFDGYIKDGVGETLVTYYNTPFKARRLVMKNRNISSLGDFLKDTRFYKPTKQCDEKGITFSSYHLADKDSFCMIQYIYIFTDKWYVFQSNGMGYWRKSDSVEKLLNIKI